MKIIVFVHGLGGWGTDENIIDYWNEIMIEKYFPKEDYMTFIASVGAISSNWDRACELYAQIKGGKVDYGKYHSELQSHKRFGIEHVGFYPEWNETKPITLIGHSMGGQTIRHLEKLLQIGDYNERKYTNSDEISSLFIGQGRLIENLITISTPHLGSPLFDIVGNYFTSKIKNIIIKIGMTFNKSEHIKEFYDMDIDQFNLEQNIDETNEEYKSRIENHYIWSSDYKDISSYDLSPKGSEEFNSISANVYDNTYYLAISTYHTYKIPGINISIVSPFMLPWLLFSGTLLGWYGHNDGLVPLESSRGPCKSTLLLNKVIEPSKWYYFDVYLDHMQILGNITIYDNIIKETFDKIKSFIET